MQIGLGRSIEIGNNALIEQRIIQWIVFTDSGLNIDRVNNKQQTLRALFLWHF